MFSGFLPSLSKIAAVVGDSVRKLDRMKQTRNGVVGLPRKYLEGKARDMANQEKWVPFADILALLIFGVVLFSNVDGLVDLAAIDASLHITIARKAQWWLSWWTYSIHLTEGARRTAHGSSAACPLFVCGWFRTYSNKT